METASTLPEFQSLNYDTNFSYFSQVANTREASSWVDRWINPKTATRWCITLGIGIGLGLLARGIQVCVEGIVSTRRDWIDLLMRDGDSDAMIEAWVIYAGVNVVLVLVGTVLTVMVAPEAAGSGIPEVKAYLNGTNVPRFLSLRTCAVKYAGTICTVASGLAVGPEGPLVHIGAVVGSALTMGAKQMRFGNHSLSLKWKWLKQFNTDAERRDFISIGAAAGFAAAFGAPIGAVLFSLEETSSFWSQTLMWRTFTATSLACFTLSFLRTWFADPTSLSDFGLLSFDEIDDKDLRMYNSAGELVPFLVIGILGGLLGALYVACWSKLMTMRSKKTSWRLAEAVTLSLVTSAITFVLPLWLRECHHHEPEGSTGGLAWGGGFGRRFDCPEGEFNDSASVMFGVREDAIKQIVMNSYEFSTTCLLSVGISVFGLMLISFGASYPAGLFMPTILSGCCLGGALGNLLEPIAGRAPFSLMGAVALLGGIQRSPISLCVVILEGTGQVQWLLPIILTTVISRWVGDRFGASIYHAAMHFKSVPFLEAEHGNLQEDWLGAHTAKDICKTGRIVCLQKKEQVGSIVQKMLDCGHCGFPVVAEAEPGPLQFTGIVLREQLMSILRNKVWEVNQDLLMFNRVSVAHSDATQHIADDINLASSFVTPIINGSRVVLQDELMRELEIKHDELAMWVDIEAVMNPCPVTVQALCPLPRVIQLFCAMGLRHLVVVDANSQVTGMITRKDLHDGVPRLKQELERNPYVDTGFRMPSSRKGDYGGDNDLDGSEQLLAESTAVYTSMPTEHGNSQLPVGARDSIL